jgi:hypothetical protein
MDDFINTYDLGDYTISYLLQLTKDEVKQIYEDLPNSQPCSHTSKKSDIWNIFLHYYVERGEDVPRPIVRLLRTYLKV